MSPTALLRGSAAFALGGTATVLGGTAKALQFVAGKLRGTVEQAAAATEATAAAVADTGGAERDEADRAPAEARPAATGVAEATARLENLAGMTSGAPPPVDEPFTPAATPPASTSSVGTAGAAQPSGLIVPADVASPGTQPPPGAPQADVGASRTFESQTAALAAKPAGEVVRAVRGMSTDELEALLDYELSHRKRKTVLGAIERELAPPTEELVYSSPDS